MSKEKETFDSISTKHVLMQIYKSISILRIVSFKTTSLTCKQLCRVHNRKIAELADGLADIHFSISGKADLDELPGAKYVDPAMHMTDLINYVERYRHLFKTSTEQKSIDSILKRCYILRSSLLLT